MHTSIKTFALAMSPALLATAILSAQKPAQTPPSPQPAQPTKPPVTKTGQMPVFRATTNYHYAYVLARDKNGKFIPDLRQEEFKVLEDGVPQTVTSFGVNVGGRMLGSLATTTAAPVSEGLILPPIRRTNDASGRIFIIFIDDLHLQAGDTPRVKDVMKTLRDTVVHEGDLVGFVSSGTSNIHLDPSYDYGHRRFDEAINRVMGSAPTTMELINGATTETGEGPSAVRYNTHVAFSAAFDMIEQLGNIPDRRKSFIYVSNGYDFNPYTQARYNKIQQQYAAAGVNDPGNTNDPNATSKTTNAALSSSSADFSNPTGVSPSDPLANGEWLKKTEFSNADLNIELAELVRSAKLGGTVFYTVDPRGLMSGMDTTLPIEIAYTDMHDHMMTQTSSMQVLAEETGGFCTCQMNDFKTAFQRIDNETSDYYVVGYNSTNPDPFKIRRAVKIEVTRPNVSVKYPEEYMLVRPKKGQ